MDMVGVFFATPLKNMSLSIGMMNFPIYGKIKHVPKHQPETSGRLKPKEIERITETAVPSICSAISSLEFDI